MRARENVDDRMMLELLSVCLVAVAVALPLAHALEWPGKMRLDKEAYLATQPIYYPGFTWRLVLARAGAWSQPPCCCC